MHTHTESYVLAKFIWYGYPAREAMLVALIGTIHVVGTGLYICVSMWKKKDVLSNIECYPYIEWDTIFFIVCYIHCPSPKESVFSYRVDAVVIVVREVSLDTLATKALIHLY